MPHNCDSFNANFLVRRPPNLHKNISKLRESTFYAVAKKSFIVLLYSSKKCPVKVVQFQTGVFQENVK